MPLMGVSGPFLSRFWLWSMSRLAADRMLPVERRFSSNGWLVTAVVARSGAQRRRGFEPLLEALERRVAGAAEAVDRLVVVADDDHVVRLVRPAADQLQQQDLGHVRVLELVDEDVPELVLVAARMLGRSVSSWIASSCCSPKSSRPRSRSSRW